MVEATEWIAYWREYEVTGIFPESDVSYELDRMARESPEAAWVVILEILSHISALPEEPTFQALAAGPLEDLLANHGAAFIERVEAEASRSPAFRMLLGGVWQNTTENSVWKRVLACNRERW